MVFFQVLLAMHANVEDRGIKGECTPLMEAASAGHLDIVRLLVAHGADVNAQSTSGMYIFFLYIFAKNNSNTTKCWYHLFTLFVFYVLLFFD